MNMQVKPSAVTYILSYISQNIIMTDSIITLYCIKMYYTVLFCNVSAVLYLTYFKDIFTDVTSQS